MPPTNPVPGVLRRFPIRLLCVATVWTFTAGANSCSTDDSGGPTFVTDLAIRNAAGNVDRDFAAGEPITFELSVRNRSRTEAVLEFPSGYTFDFVVLNDGTRQIRWKWSHGKAFPQGRTDIEFAPGETKIFQTTWNQAGNDGQPVGAGDFEARGVMGFARFDADPLAPNQLGSPLRSFTIH